MLSVNMKAKIDINHKCYLKGKSVLRHVPELKNNLIHNSYN